MPSPFDNLEGPPRRRRRDPGPSRVGLVVSSLAGVAVLAVAGVVAYLALAPARHGGTPSTTAASKGGSKDGGSPHPGPTKDGAVTVTPVQPSPGKQRTPAWLLDADAELAAARSLLLRKEPLPKPVLMTEQEYQQAKEIGARWFETMRPDNIALEMLRGDMEAVYPRTTARFRREGLLGKLVYCVGRSGKDEKGLENLDIAVTTSPVYRPLLDPALRDRLLDRLPWQEREALFNEFAQATGIKESWSLTHPFDDLDGAEMRSLPEVLRRVKVGGLASLTKEQRQLLLRAGAIDFFQRHLPQP